MPNMPKMTKLQLLQLNELLAAFVAFYCPNEKSEEADILTDQIQQTINQLNTK